MLPRERIKLYTVHQNYAALLGYVYKVYDTTGKFLGWWPFSNADASLKKGRFAYSLLLHDLNFNNIHEVKINKNSSISIFPNPTADQQTLIVNTSKSEFLNIGLYDISGREIKTIYSGESNIGKQIFSTNLNNLNDGLYVYRICLGDKIMHVKIVKN